MKSIINGKRYDTDKATLVGQSGYNGSRSDFQWWEAGLYKTPRSGAFFLAGRGGPMTQWSRKTDSNTWTGGSGIIPLEVEDARAWAEQYLDAEVIEQHFKIEDA